MKKADICFYGKDYVYRINVDANVSDSYWLYQKIQGKLQPIIELKYDENGWSWHGSKQCCDAQQHTEGKIEIYGLYLFYGNEPWCLLFQKLEEKKPYKIYILSDDEITIGRDNQCNIQYCKEYVSNIHAKIYKQDRWILEDNSSKNGSYVNQNRADKHILSIGDCIHIMGLEIIFLEPFILIPMLTNISISYLDEYKILQNNYQAIDVGNIHKEVVYFPKMIEDGIKIKKPQIYKSTNDYPLWLTIGPSCTMGIISMMMGLGMVIQGIVSKQLIWQNISSVLMMQGMSLSMIFWPLLNRKYEKKQIEKKQQMYYLTYKAYCEKKQNEINGYIKNIEDDICKKIDYWTNDKKGYWFIDSKDMYFGQFLLGNGDIKINIPIQTDIQESEQAEEEEFGLFNDLYEQRIKNIYTGIFFDLKKSKHIGIYGEKSIYMVFYILLQLCKTHDPNKLKIILMSRIEYLKQYPISLLSHLFFNGQRCLFTDVNQLSYLDLLLKSMEKNKVSCILIFMYPKIQKVFSIDFILQKYPFLHIIQQEFEKEDLYSIYSDYINVQQQDLFTLETDEVKQQVQLYPFKKKYMQTVFLKLSKQSHEDFMKKTYDFLDLYECGNIEMLDISKRWKEHKSYGTLNTLIGIDEYGEKLYLDAHETKHGPHGIVAGMTGSGKSEFLISYILSLCINYSCEEITFILIDYKGGGMADALSKLPHVAYVLTNLDQNCMQRFCDALQAEVINRQKRFKKVMNMYHMTNMDIDLYHELSIEKKVLVPIPHLFIIADEFAELKTQHPEFMQQVKQAARIGRSLGIHLILATQKPSGCIDDEIWSNARFHICLKVQDRSDSVDMLKKEDACFLQKSGDFYLQVGNDELFRKGYAPYTQTPYIPYDMYELKQEKEVIGYDNFMHQIYKECFFKKDVQRNSQLSEICTYVQQLSKLQKYKVPFFIQPALSFHEQTVFNESLQPCLGKMEESKNRIQVPFYLFKENFQSMLLLGKQNSGKCLFIKQWLYELIRLSNIQKQWIIILDGSDNKFIEFENLSIITIIKKDEKEKIESFIYQFKNHILKEEIKFCIRMIIYDYSIWKEIYEDFDECLCSWILQSKNRNIQYCITNTTFDGITYRMLSYFEDKYCFQLQNQTDYQQMFQHIEIFPSLKKGNGVMERNHHIYNFQILPYTKDNKCKILNKVQNNNPIFEIPLLPKIIYPKFQNKKLYIGINVITKEHCWISLPAIVFVIRAFQIDNQYKQYLSIYQEKFRDEIKIMDDISLIDDCKTCVCFLNLRGLVDLSMHSSYMEWLYTANFVWIGKGLSEAASLLRLPMEFMNKELDECEAIWYRKGECVCVKLLEMSGDGT